jgi:peptidoglycan/LPS O-acetylase OafA/YrhL
MKKYLALLAVLIVPIIAFGQTLDFQQGGIIDNLTGAINTLIPFFIGIAVFIFIVGLIRYVNAGGDEDKVKSARSTIIWGLIIIFVMFSAVGIVNILNNTFNFDNQLDKRQGPRI